MAIKSAFSWSDMAFTIKIKSDYIQIDAFYPYEGWDREIEDETEEDIECRELIKKSLAVDPTNQDEIDELWSVVEDPGKDYLEGEAWAIHASYATIEVDDEEIDDPFKGEEYDAPEPEVLIPEVINHKFCFLKVWENNGEWEYEGEGEFELSKLTWVKGHFLYDGEEFEFIGSDGHSSYEAFYKDGVQV